MRVVKVTEIEAGMEPVAFEDRQGRVHTGQVISYLQYRKVLRLTGGIDKLATEEAVEAAQREILTTLGFDEAGVAAGLGLTMRTFFAVVEDFFDKNRRRRADAGEETTPTPATPTPGPGSTPAASD